MARRTKFRTKPRNEPRNTPGTTPGTDPKPAAGISVEQAMSMAYSYWTGGQLAPAEQLCRQVLEAWPGQTDALHLLGLMAHGHGNLDLAVEYLRAACQAPLAPSVYFSNFAEMCRQKGLLAEGEQAARRALALDPGSAGGWNNLGIILQEQGKLEESLSCLLEVVARTPDNPEAHNNLGNTYRRLGRLQAADRSYERALALRPAYAEAMSNRTDLWRELGRLDEAAALVRRAIDHNPQLVGGYLNAAAIESDRQRPLEALRHLDALLAFAPMVPAALSARAAALLALGLSAEALEVAERAAAAAPGEMAALRILAQCLGALGRTDEALAVLDRKAMAGEEPFMLSRGVLLLEAGRLGEAGRALDELVARWPRSGLGWLMRGETRTYGGDDPGIVRMESLLEPGGLEQATERTALHFALGKAWMDAGNAERAFRHFEQGNRRKRATLHHDPDATDRWMVEVAEAFPASLIAERRAAGSGARSDLPIFVVGMPRSGTTLVEQVLAAHPRVRGGGELTALERAVDRSGGGRAVAQLGPEDLAVLGRRYLDAVAPLATGAERLVDKMPLNFLHAGAIALALPGARLVHVRRDPLDTCLSCYTKLFQDRQSFAYDLAELGRFHAAYQRLMAHWRAALPPGMMIEVEYEALVDDLEGESRRLLDFCGMPWHPDVLSFHQAGRIVRSASLAQVRRPVYRSSVGRWRSYEQWLGPLLQALER